jgi:hypothetical protein
MLTAGPEGAASSTLMVGSRGADPQYPDRFFRGDVFEIAVFNRALTTAEHGRVVAYMRDRWAPDPAPDCRVPLPCALPPSTARGVAACRCLVGKLAAAGLGASIPSGRAALAAQYADAHATRCAMQSNGTLPLLPTTASTLAGLQSYVHTIDQMVAGLQALAGWYRSSSDAWKATTAAAWAACGGLDL